MYHQLTICCVAAAISANCLLVLQAEAINVREAFDTIVLMNVLEHCQDAPAIFNNVYNALKPGGAGLNVSTPRGG